MTWNHYPTLKEVDEANDDLLAVWLQNLRLPVTALERVIYIRIDMKLKGKYVP